MRNAICREWSWVPPFYPLNSLAPSATVGQNSKPPRFLFFRGWMKLSVFNFGGVCRVGRPWCVFGVSGVSSEAEREQLFWGL